MEPCLESPFLGWGDLLQMRLLKLLPWLRPHQSVDQYLRRFFQDPRVRLAFCFQSKYLGMSPFRCPSLFSILSFLEYEYGVWHPMGGCNAVTLALANVARRLGVEIHLDEPVEEIVMNGRRAVGVRTRSGVEPADGVVLNADFARAMERLVPNGLRRRWTDAKLARKKYSCSTFMLYLGVEGRFDLPHHTIHIARDYEGNLADIELRHVLSEDPSFYVQNACVTDDSLAPKGCSSLYVLAPVTHLHPNVDWKREAKRYRDLLLRKIAQAGYEDVERRIRYERVLTPETWDQGYEIYRGATFNLAHSLDQMLHLRPRNRFEEFDGLYLVGGGTHPGSGLPVIFESARISSRLLLEDLGLEPFLIASTMLGALAQRLVRRICPHCTEPYTEDAAGLRKLGFPVTGKETVVLHRGKGCIQCRNTGYLGRLGIFEIFPMSDQLKKLIAAQANDAEMRQVAIREGMTTLREDAWRKVQAGQTTVEEALRVTGEM
jgi:phytoene desaturase